MRSLMFSPTVSGKSLVRHGDFSSKWKVPHWKSVNTTALFTNKARIRFADSLWQSSLSALATYRQMTLQRVAQSPSDRHLRLVDDSGEMSEV